MSIEDRFQDEACEDYARQHDYDQEPYSSPPTQLSITVHKLYEKNRSPTQTPYRDLSDEQRSYLQVLYIRSGFLD